MTVLIFWLGSVWEITPSACCSPPPAFRPEMNSVEGKEWLEDFLCVSRVPPSDYALIAHYLLSDSFPRLDHLEIAGHIRPRGVNRVADRAVPRHATT
ncbi:hypothetical protein T08_3250 [Trichinella sp. T8]|nr:hypothetical protein T08_3250 [Trichinella sp. T8]